MEEGRELPIDDAFDLVDKFSAMNPMDIFNMLRDNGKSNPMTEEQVEEFVSEARTKKMLLVIDTNIIINALDTALVWAKALWTTVGGKNFPPLSNYGFLLCD